MTRRDFQLIARTLRDSEARAGVRMAMSKALATTNPKFDHARFMRESEPPGQPKWERRRSPANDSGQAADSEGAQAAT